jgi:hypothetical protein
MTPRHLRLAADEEPTRSPPGVLRLVGAILLRAMQDAQGRMPSHGSTRTLAANLRHQRRMAALHWWFAPCCVQEVAEWADVLDVSPAHLRQAVWRLLPPETQDWVRAQWGEEEDTR